MAAARNVTAQPSARYARQMTSADPTIVSVRSSRYSYAAVRELGWVPIGPSAPARPSDSRKPEPGESRNPRPRHR